MKQPPSSIPPDDFRDPTIRFTEGILDFNFRVRPSLKDMLSDVHHCRHLFSFVITDLLRNSPHEPVFACLHLSSSSRTLRYLSCTSSRSCIDSLVFRYCSCHSSFSNGWNTPSRMAANPRGATGQLSTLSKADRSVTWLHCAV